MFKVDEHIDNGTLCKQDLPFFPKKESHLDVFFNRVDLETGIKCINNEIFPSKKLKNIKQVESNAKG